MSEWNAWGGRGAARLARTGGARLPSGWAPLAPPRPADGTVPQGFHWCLCTPDAATAQLGPDGHPLRDDSPDSFLPPVPLPRRMWASSKVEFLAPLRSGQAVKRVSRVASVTAKQGGSGSLVFVDVAHETFGEDALAVREVQSLVYRDAAPADAPLSPPALGEGSFDASAWDAHRIVVPSEPLLFRYSALTFNSHRIHYDLPYARDVERYRALVVHGPLTSTLLLALAQRELGDNALKTFAFRGVSPGMCGEELNLAMRKTETGYELGAFAADGRQVASASATA